MKPVQQPEKVLSVSEITEKIKTLLEDSFWPLWISGEISNLKHHSSGHVYFSLKDADAQLRCVMFRTAASKMAFEPEHGMQVRAYGSIGVFEKHGIYQLYVEKLEPSGKGALHLAFEKLKKKLQEEGLFDTARKKPIPKFPQRIGIVTSETGAALRDIIHVIERRYPVVTLYLCPARVQGDGAAEEIVQGIHTFQNMPAEKRPEILIVGRGGGSLEDLWSFNEESVARAIADCSIPVISAVGHEVDFTISDFVADRRAPTPSAAAEIAVPDRAVLLQMIQKNHDRLIQEYRRYLELMNMRVSKVEGSNLFKPQRVIRELSLQIDALENRIVAMTKHMLQEKESRLGKYMMRLAIHGPKEYIMLHRAHFNDLFDRFIRTVKDAMNIQQEKINRIIEKTRQFNISGKRSAFDLLHARLMGFSPKAILARGYAICKQSDGHIVTSYQEVAERELVEVELSEGALDCKIERRRFL